MPMWMFKRRPAPPPRPPDPGAVKRALSDRLLDAIAADDVNAARQIFDKAFWDKTGFKPDGFHLLQAVRRQNREMVKLVTIHGAKWTAEEARLARLNTGPEAWEKSEGVLRHAGIRTEFTETELKKIDAVAAVQWARRTLEEAERVRAAELPQLRAAFDRLAGVTLTLLVKDGKMDAAIRLLQGRKGKGSGHAVDPLNLDREFRELIIGGGGKPDLALRLLDALKEKKLHVLPLRPGSIILWMAPGIVKQLETRALLDDMRGQPRLDVLRSWSVLQPEVPTQAGIFRLDEEVVKKQHAAISDAAQALFRKPATAEEAEEFMRIHAARAKQTPQALVRMDVELDRTFFFNSPAFTPERLRQLAADLPAEDADAQKLSRMFNREAMAHFVVAKGRGRLAPAEIAEAQRLAVFSATANETVKVMQHLQKQVKKDAVPPEVKETLRAMKNAGADFSRIDPNDYIGKRAPGLAKTLLDLGIVEARRIDIEAIASSYGGEVRPLTPKGAPGYDDHDFMCQVILETVDPEKFVPLRGQENVNYGQHFLRECATSPKVRRFMRLSPSMGPR